MTNPKAPTTPAGRALLETWKAGRTHPPSTAREAEFVGLILDIERQAGEQALALAAERVAGLRGGQHAYWYVKGVNGIVRVDPVIACVALDDVDAILQPTAERREAEHPVTDRED